MVTTSHNVLLVGVVCVVALSSLRAETRDPDPSTLTGKVMCGYQGWFTAEGDGSRRPWTHYSKKRQFKPGQCSIDLWPDVSELDADEKYPTPFRHRDGSVASVFSSRNPKTVSRHFRWMKEYGIDGALVQRFAVRLRGGAEKPDADLEAVLANCRGGAAEHGRVWAVMYDLSGLKAGEVRRVAEDWRRLTREEKVTSDATYLHHRGKPVVAVWGVGFNDGREYTLEECDSLVDALKEGGYAVMLGVPTGWRTLDHDSVRDEGLHAVLRKADVLSPWTVGRYRLPVEVEKHAAEKWKPDGAWCGENGIDYLPVVFPGFSWHNMNPDDPLDMYPRRSGQFLWSQFAAAVDAGAEMVYVAMFDEMDEGTAIFKCTNDPPAGASPFLTYEGLPSDHYLWLTGEGGRLLRGEIEAGPPMPMPVR